MVWFLICVFIILIIAVFSYQARQAALARFRKDPLTRARMLFRLEKEKSKDGVSLYDYLVQQSEVVDNKRLKQIRSDVALVHIFKKYPASFYTLNLTQEDQALFYDDVEAHDAFWPDGTT
jgi:hypothetical protein